MFPNRKGKSVIPVVAVDTDRRINPDDVPVFQHVTFVREFRG